MVQVSIRDKTLKFMVLLHLVGTKADIWATHLDEYLHYELLTPRQ